MELYEKIQNNNTMMANFVKEIKKTCAIDLKINTNADSITYFYTTKINLFTFTFITLTT